MFPIIKREGLIDSAVRMVEGHQQRGRDGSAKTRSRAGLAVTAGIEAAAEVSPGAVRDGHPRGCAHNAYWNGWNKSCRKRNIPGNEYPGKFL